MYEKLDCYVKRAIKALSSNEKILKRLMYSRKIYEDLTGKLDEDDPEYESRMLNFNEWFLFDFLTDEQQYPFMIEFLNCLDEPVDDIKELVSGVRYSFFECRKSTIGLGGILEDFLKGKKYRVPLNCLPFNLLSRELFTGRIIGINGEVFLFEGIRWLPKEIKALARAKAKRIRNQGVPSVERSFVFSLEMASTRCRQFKHLSPAEVIESILENQA